MDEIPQTIPGSVTCRNQYLVCRGPESDPIAYSNKTSLEMSTAGFWAKPYGGPLSAKNRRSIHQDSYSAKAGFKELEAMEAAGIFVDDLRRGEPGLLLDNKCTQSWLQKTLDAAKRRHQANGDFRRIYSSRSPSYMSTVWGEFGLLCFLLRNEVLPNLHHQLAKLYRVQVLIREAINFRNEDRDFTMRKFGDPRPYERPPGISEEQSYGLEFQHNMVVFRRRQTYEQHRAMITSMDHTVLAIVGMIADVAAEIASREAADRASTTPPPRPSQWGSVKQIREPFARLVVQHDRVEASRADRHDTRT
jgi:hypothetical protein